MRRTAVRAASLSLLAGAGLALTMVVASMSAAMAYDDRGPSPDMAAWEIFVRAAAPSGRPGADELEFETWASDSDTFAASPPRWPDAGSPRALPECKQAFDRDAARAAGFPDDGCIAEEVRRNWAAFRYLASNHLTTKTGLAKAFARSLKIDLPADSVQVKADWMKVGDLARWLHCDESEVRRSYYTRIDRSAGANDELALVGMHLNSKRWTNWLWATFEDRLNPGRCDDIGCHDAFGAAIAHVLGREPANQNYGDCRKTPELIAMFANAGLDPVWLNYCLKGSQVSFADKPGRPNLLGNSVIDRINGRVPMAHSSCMSCHALASFDKSGDAGGGFGANAIGAVEAARPKGHLSSNFVWGVTKAR
jgi:hypothetical protein